MTITIKEVLSSGKILKVQAKISLKEVVESESALSQTFNKLIGELSTLLREETDRLEKKAEAGPEIILPPGFKPNGASN